MSRLRQAAVFLLVFGLSFSALYVSAGGIFYHAPEQHKIQPPPPLRGERKMIPIKRKGKVVAEIPQSQTVTGVRVRLEDQLTGLEEGWLVFEKGVYDPESKKLRLTRPVITTWEIDRDRRVVDRSRENVLSSEIGLLDTEFKRADLYRNVVLKSAYRGSLAVTETSHLVCWLEEDRVETDEAVAISWGPDMTVLGTGLRGRRQGEEARLMRDVLVRLVQEGDHLALPLPGAGGKPGRPAGGKAAKDVKPAERTEIVATCDGEMVARRLADGKEWQITFHKNVEVIRGKGRMRSQLLKLGLAAVDPKAVPARKPGAAKSPHTGPGAAPLADEARKVDLHRMVALEQVEMYSPAEGAAYGDFFSWEKLPSARQRTVLSGRPRLVLAEGSQLKLLARGDAPKGGEEPTKVASAPKAAQGSVVITSQGDMVFVKSSPEEEQADQAVFYDNVVVRRPAVGQDRPVELRADKLTLYLQVVHATKEDTPLPASPGDTRKRTELRRAVAEGDVRITEAALEATGQRCVWEDLGYGEERTLLTGRPKLLLRAVEDKEQMSLDGSAEAAPERAPGQARPRSDLEIACRGETVLRSWSQRGFIRAIFDRDVVVRRLPLAADGRRLPSGTQDERRSTTWADHLEIDLRPSVEPPREGGPTDQRKAGAKPADQISQRYRVEELRAWGNVQTAAQSGQTSSGRLRWEKASDLVTLEEEVLALAADGGRYQGDVLVYDRKANQLTLTGAAHRPALAQKTEEKGKDAPPAGPDGAAVPSHLVQAPRIFYDRKTGYMKATEGVYSRFLPRPGKDEDDLLMGGPEKPAKGAEDEKGGKKEVRERPRTPWVLKCLELEAWLDPATRRPPAKKPGDKKKEGDPQAPAAKGGEGELVRLLAVGRVHIYATGAEHREATGDWFEHDRKARKSVLKGHPDRARLWSGSDQLVSHEVRFDHEKNIATCPGGGTARFKEKDAKALPGEKPPEGPGAKPEAKEAWTQVECDGLMVHDRKNHHLTFEKNVQILRAESLLKSDEADVRLDPKTRRIQRGVATGKQVTLLHGTDLGLGTRVVWDEATNVAVLSGVPQARLQQGDRVVHADEVHFNQKTRETSYRGGVRIETTKGK